MPRPCFICGHPQRLNIEAEFVAGRSPRTIAAAHGLNFQAVYRHARNHLPTTLQTAAAAHLANLDALPSSDQGDVAFQIPAPTPAPQNSMAVSGLASPVEGPSPLESVATGCNFAPTQLDPFSLACELRNSALAVLTAAEAKGDQGTTLNAVRAMVPLLDRLERLTPRGIVAGSTVPLAQSSEWTRVRSAIITALAPFPEARLAVAEALAAAGALQ